MGWWLEAIWKTLTPCVPRSLGKGAGEKKEPGGHPQTPVRRGFAPSALPQTSISEGPLEYLRLLKLRIVLLLVLLAAVSAMVALGDIPSWAVLLPLGTTGALASAGASALNHYMDRGVDAAMVRTRQRALPSGRIRQPGRALFLGLALVLLSIPFALSLNPWVALFTLAGAFIYVVVYTWWLKPRTSKNILVGGLAGSCAVIAGWFAASGHATPALPALALLVFLWTPAHFWSFALVHQDDYRRAGVPMLPVVVGERRASRQILLCTALVVATSLLLYLISPMGSLYLVGALLLGSVYLGVNLALWQSPSVERAWSSYKSSGVYLLLLLLVMAGDVALGLPWNL
ncbi:MAG: protoheme IX farnesyltransferase [Chloroflexi bacterium]|nr:protoheme IX farnesyltransferase [Chloroflexota bacterium]